MDRGYFDFAKYGSIGIAWVLSTSIYLYLGYKGGTYLDQRMSSAPLFMVTGLLLGIALSLKSLVTQVLELTEAFDKNKEKTDHRAPDREKGNKN